MQGSEKIPTQKERFAEELKRLKNSITAKDREDFKVKYKVSQPTLSQYLNGTISNLDRAADMIGFFKERIAEREKVLVS